MSAIICVRWVQWRDFVNLVMKLKFHIIGQFLHSGANPDFSRKSSCISESMSLHCTQAELVQ
jgi:hypothetical protein